MRLTISCDPRRRGLRVQVERALDYPPGHVPGLLAAAVTEALLTRPPAAGQAPERVPTPRTAPDEQAVPVAPVAGPAPEVVEERLRWRVLRALDGGATVAEAVRRFGIDPTLIDGWDDDAALDARTDLLADGPGGHRPRRVAS